MVRRMHGMWQRRGFEGVVDPAFQQTLLDLCSTVVERDDDAQLYFDARLQVFRGSEQHRAEWPDSP